MLQLGSTSKSKSFINNTEFSERLYTEAQVINYLESYIKNKTTKKSGSKKQFVFFWTRAKQKLLTGTEEFASLVETDEEGNIFSPGPDQGEITFDQAGDILGS